MITPRISLSCIAFAWQPSLKNVTPSGTTRLFSEVSSDSDTTTNLPPQFPRWLRLAAIAPISQRHDMTTKVADLINNKSGGFVSNANLLSDMVTAILIEDMEPQKIPNFWLSLKELDLEWTNASKDQLELCEQLLASASDGVPPQIHGVLQLTWRGAHGKLRHEIPADG
ncbi:unnamed protein product [Cylindrotheca closterium]|uniref:Uncharacterized protein n=1 Tax=Cylindrotheca closterium TaxID=2856 RepID=A0AAD2FSL4_9STRA|nr:unnamed protein product [Cylindrotheca closterium]